MKKKDAKQTGIPTEKLLSEVTNNVEVNDVRLAYVLSRRRDDTVIFIHDALSDYRYWRNQIRAFSERYCVFAYSQRYHYPNAQDGEGSDYKQSVHAKDLIDLMEKLDLAPAHLVGAAGGAWTAMLVAWQQPESVRSLVLAEPPIISLIMENRAALPALEDFQRNFLEPIRNDLDAIPSVAEKQAAYMGASAFAQVSEDIYSMWQDNAAALKAGFSNHEPFEPFLPEQVAQINVPTLLLDGENSPEILQFINDEVEKYMPDIFRVSIPDTAVAPGLHVQNADAYNKVVLDFLTGQII